MYRLVASDMDETFLDSGHEVPETNIEAIRELRKLGCLFVPASGRAYGSVMESLHAIPPELLEGSYLISYNGGCLNRIGDAEPLSYHTLPHEKAEALYAYGIKLGCVSMHVYEVSGKVWGWNLQPEEVDYLAGHMDIEPTDATSLDFLKDVPIAKMLYCIPDGTEELQRIEREMPEELKRGTSTTFSSGRYLEFNPEGVNKGQGLRNLAKLLHIDLAETIAVGDAANDASMVDAAGVGVCVANARDGLDRIADYRAASTNDDGVMKEILEKIVRPANEA